MRWGVTWCNATNAKFGIIQLSPLYSCTEEGTPAQLMYTTCTIHRLTDNGVN